ncbi:50S ribosomal protein L30 [Erysipelotrichaceae bacterium]|nr:50S ribosomal protein L30 [Erysipelotrichaceae bacterium]
MAKQLAITLKKSIIGAKKNQKATVEALGLRKIRQTVVQTDSASLRGMITIVAHLVEVTEV